MKGRRNEQSTTIMCDLKIIKISKPYKVLNKSKNSYHVDDYISDNFSDSSKKYYFVSRLFN